MPFDIPIALHVLSKVYIGTRFREILKFSSLGKYSAALLPQLDAHRSNATCLTSSACVPHSGLVSPEVE